MTRTERPRRTPTRAEPATPANPPATAAPAVSTARRVAEVGLAVAALALALPVLAAAAALVALTSPGGAVYTQTRVGRGGRPFRIYKLRSMVADSEVHAGAQWSPGQGDPRVTPVGRVLRRTHLDELPQLWNVVRGEMAFVGPRPERPEILAGLGPLIPGLDDRLAVRPGVTGLAQIQQPADTTAETFRDKLEYDRLYIRESSAWLDVRIAVGTAFYLAGLSYAAVRLLTALPRPAALAQPADGRDAAVPAGAAAEVS